ncbi:MAG: amino acid ABC transporter substrate-binding protein [Gammaproteobacteria bacterium]|nr:amino acid ABC transporter substrate-binding protein [Gammaproteobacteria bacterium]
MVWRTCQPGAILKALFFGLVATVLLVFVSTDVRSEDLNVGANIGNVPWEFQNARGEFIGFELDLIRKIAERMGRTASITNIPFNGLFAAVQSGRIDIAVSSITITDKRLRSVSFAQPYYDSAQSLTVSSRSDAEGLDDMRDKIIGVDTGSTGDIWATANQARYGFSGIRRFEGLAPAMLDLQSGRLHGYISDIPALEYFIKNKPQYRIVERIETGESYSLMLAKDSPLGDEINEVISRLKEEAYIADLHKKWFGSEPGPLSSTVIVSERSRAP